MEEKWSEIAQVNFRKEFRRRWNEIAIVLERGLKRRERKDGGDDEINESKESKKKNNNNKK